MKKTKKEKPYRSTANNFIWSSKLQLKYAPLGFIIRIFGIPVGVALSYCGIYLPSLIVKQAISGNTFADVQLADYAGVLHHAVGFSEIVTGFAQNNCSGHI